MLTGPDPVPDLADDVAQSRPFGGARRPARMAGRVRALREAEDDAQTVLAFQLTGLATHAIDPAEVVWVVDLAPGEGERAWRVLKAVSCRAPRAAPIRYMACCVDIEHHARMAAHPLLKPLISDGSLFLDRESRGVPAHIVRNPIVVLAHEGISSLSQGLYAAHSGELLEAWHDGRGGMDWRATTRRDGVMRLLSTYRQSLDAVAFTLPCGAMQALSALLQASRGRLLLRASDRGAMDIPQIRRGALKRGAVEQGVLEQDASPRRREPASRRHPDEVLPVNFEALARWHRAHGASVHQTQRDDDGRVLHIALHDVAGGRLQECLPDVIGLPHPDDHVQMLLAFEALSDVPPAQCLALLHAQAGDPRALLALSRHMRQAAPMLEGAALSQWREMLVYCRSQHYPRFDADGEGDGIHEMFADLEKDLHAPSPGRAAIVAAPLAGDGDPRP